MENSAVTSSVRLDDNLDLDLVWASKLTERLILQLRNAKRIRNLKKLFRYENLTTDVKELYVSNTFITTGLQELQKDKG